MARPALGPCVALQKASPWLWLRDTPLCSTTLVRAEQRLRVSAAGGRSRVQDAALQWLASILR